MINQDIEEEEEVGSKTMNKILTMWRILDNSGQFWTVKCVLREKGEEERKIEKERKREKEKEREGFSKRTTKENANRFHRHLPETCLGRYPEAHRRARAGGSGIEYWMASCKLHRTPFGSAVHLHEGQLPTTRTFFQLGA